MLTHDMDFSAILAVTGREKASVAQLRTDDVSPDVIGTQLVAALRQTKADLEVGALVTLGPNRTRLRLLPLRLKDE